MQVPLNFLLGSQIIQVYFSNLTLMLCIVLTITSTLTTALNITASLETIKNVSDHKGEGDFAEFFLSVRTFWS